MGVRALSSTSVGVPVGGVWALVVSVTDSCGAPVTDAPTVTATLPGDVPADPTVTEVTGGIYRAELVTTVTGRYVAQVVSGGNGSVGFVAQVTEVVADADMPDVAAVSTYLGEHSWSDGDLQDALDAETAAQFRVCAVPSAYPDDLREALLRRVQRNLVMRGQPFMTVPDSDVPTLIPSRDAEIRRFEAPFLRLPMG